MVDIKILEAKRAASTCHRSEAKEKLWLTPKQDQEQPDRFLKRRSGSLKRGTEIDLLKMKSVDFNLILASLKNTSNTALRLYNRSLGSDGEFGCLALHATLNMVIPVRFRPSDPTTCAALEKFSRALARAVGAGGWIQQLELGFRISRQDIKGLSQAISGSSHLQQLSLANSALGDEKLQLLARGLCECLSLQVLDLSGCNLTDASVTSITSIIKVGVRRIADAEWRLSLRESGGSKLKRRTPRPTVNQGLAALDLSFNMFSDATSRQLCDVLQLGAPLEALNLQGNRLRRKSAQMYLVMFHTWGVPRLVDLRKNLDGKDVGVLEDGRHLSSFSTRQAPFWNESPLVSPFENIRPKERNTTSSQKRRPGRNSYRSPRPSSARDKAASGEHSRGLIKMQTLSRAAEGNNREDPDQTALVGWSSRANSAFERDSSSKDAESIAKEAYFPEPQGNDEIAGQVSFKPLIPSLRLDDPLDQTSAQSWTKQEDQISTSPLLDIRKAYPALTESENRRSQSDDIYGDLSPLHPNKQPSEQIGEGPPRPLSPILDPATAELESRNQIEVAPNTEQQGRNEHPNRTLGELTPSISARAQRSVDDAKRDHAARLDVRQDPNFTSRTQPAEHKVRKSAQMHPKRSSSKNHEREDRNPQLVPGTEVLQCQNIGKTTTSGYFTRNQRASQFQPHPLHSTSEWQQEETEWGEFTWGMANSLLRLQEGLDFLMQPSQLDAEKADQVAATELPQKPNC